nr:copia protein [Tanacetum cinerariifolium]
IKREYCNARTLQQNRVTERKNRTLIEAARTMLADSFLHNTFWAEAVSIACYVLNRFEEKSDEGFLVGYSLNSKAFRVYNLETKRVEENLHINFLENKPNVVGKGPTWLFDLDYLTDSMNYVTVKNKANKTLGPEEANNSAEAKNGDLKLNGDTGSKTNKEPIDQDDQAFLEELERLKRQAKEADDVAKTFRKMFAQGTEDLLFQARAVRASSTNYVNTVRIPVNTASTPVNTASPLRNGHKQEEGIDYDEVFAPVARIKAIRIFSAFASYMIFIVYHMDVKSAFLYGKIDKELYASQPLGFIDPKFPKKVYKVVKALYGLHQAPRAWYATLFTFLVKIRYRRGIIDKTMFIKKDKKDIMLVQVYVDDIIFSTKKSWCDEFEALIKSRFQMSSMGKLTFFLGLQVTLKTSHLHAVKRIFRYLKGQLKLGLWYPKESAFNLEAYSDSDYAGANLDKKSTTRGCQFFGRRLISWKCKKQTIMATSTIEAEYVAIANCWGQGKKAKTRLNIEEGNFNELDDLVGERDDYALNKGRSTDKIKVLNAKAEGVSVAGETLSTATLAVSTASV